MEIPAVTDRTVSGLDTDRLRLSSMADGSDYVDDTAQKEEKSPEENEEIAKSLGAVKFYFANETGEGIKEEQKTPEKSINEDIEIEEDGSDWADDISKREERAPEEIEEEASGLRAAKSDFSNENVDEEETDETSHIEDSGETIQKEESTPQKSVTEEDMKIKEDAISLRANGLDWADDIALEKIEEDATSLKETESDFGHETLCKEETDETSYVEDSGETIQEENTPEKSVDDEDMKVKEDAISLRANGLVYTDDIALEEEKAPEKIEEVATNLRAEKSDFANGSYKEDTDENIEKEESSPEKSTIEDPRIQDDKTSFGVESSDYADYSTNKEERTRENIQEDATSLEAKSYDFAHDHEAYSKEETATENIQEYATSLGAEGSDFADDHQTHGKEETVEDAKREEKIPEESTEEKILDDATRMRAEGSGFVDDTDIEEEKAPHGIQEDSTSFGTVSSGFVDKTALKEGTNEDSQEEMSISEKSIVEEDKKVQDGAASLRADGSDCPDDTAQTEEKSPVKSTTEQIQEDDTRLRVQKSDLADESAPKEETDENAKKEEEIPESSVVEMDEKIEDVAASSRAEGSVCIDNETVQESESTPVKSSTGLIQENATSLRVQNSDSADETTHEVSDNHGMVEEPRKKEETTQEESSQANAEPDIPASTSGRTANPASSAAPSTASPAGLGCAARLLEPAPRVVQQSRVNGTTSQAQTQQIEDSNGEAEEYDETREQLQMIRVKFLRLAYRLGQTPHNVVVAQVLYRLGLAEQLRGRNGGRVGAFSFDRASAMAEQLEAAGQEPLDFSCTIMVLGKTGVGKSATINSIFDEQKFVTSAFQMGTQKVQDVIGTVQGIKVRVIDTPGLLSSWSDQRQNVKILNSVKQFIKKSPPDIVLYLDRLDMQSRDFGDMPLLRTITEIFGPSIWFNAIVVLTHAASAPPDGPNGTASSYDMFVTQRSHVVQQSIRQAAGDMRLMNPVSLVENHSACRTNRAGQRVLPNGQVWKPHLLLLSFASKILAEANTLLKLQDNSPGKPSTRSRAPPLPFLLSSLLQSRPPLKLPGEQVVVDEDDLDDSSDSDNETEYDDLPPFTRLTKAQVAMLTKAQKRAYFDELAYREKLFMKKQLKEEKRQRKMMKKMADSGLGMPTENIETVEEESDTAIPPAPMPDLALPASFDSSNPTHRYRCLDSASQWVVRPVLDTHGWDRDVGYEGINVERLFVVKNKLPVSFSGQASKDKKDANIQMEINSSLSHGQGKSTSMGFDLQTVGKDMAYTLRGETKFCNHRRNKATAGLSATVLGDALSTGVKLEDKLIINKCLSMVMAGGAMSGRGDVAYGGSLEAQWRDKDYPIGSFLSTLGLSIMDWHGDLAIGGNIQSQVPIGRSSNLIARANLNNRGAGQINIRFNSSEQLQIALFGLIPLLRKALDRFSQSQYGQQ